MRLIEFLGLQTQSSGWLREGSQSGHLLRAPTTLSFYCSNVAFLVAEIETKVTFPAPYWVFPPLKSIDFSLDLGWSQWSLSESEHWASGCGANVLECQWPWIACAHELTASLGWPNYVKALKHHNNLAWRVHGRRWKLSRVHYIVLITPFTVMRHEIVAVSQLWYISA